ncbi:hypothetical protein DRO30_03155 [Candidatus Bathyarchaeota archaeon]|nr:MAG: hypothetical protein DRO30_03155 [Candidatus Bathyarchaeota archaeon]
MLSRKRILTLSLLIISFTIIPVFQQSSSYADKWILYTPNPDTVNIKVLKYNRLVKVEVSIVFPHGGFRVDWGSLKKQGSTFYSNSKVEMWTGPSIQVVTKKSYTYNLGELSPGKYWFVFLVNGEAVKTINFKVLDWKSDLEIFGWRILALLIFLLIVALPIFSLGRRKK